MNVLRCGELPPGALESVLAPYGIVALPVPPGRVIPGSYWGEPEAGVSGEKLYFREDTPAHSALHEACHIICMSPDRRACLEGDAGGDHEEENGVCYLQVILSGHLPGMGRERMFRDMDAWGYSFRRGSAGAWFATDAEDARAWLCSRGLVDTADRPTWRLRGSAARRVSPHTTGGCRQ